MSNKKTSPNLKAVPMFPYESVYIGVDIGKLKHVAGFVSKTLVERHKHFENCPAFSFEASREGFRSLWSVSVSIARSNMFSCSWS